MATRAHANTTPLAGGVTFTGTSGAGSLDPSGRTYAAYKTALSSSSSPTIPVAVTDLADVAVSNAGLDADDSDLSLAVSGTVDATTDPAFANSPLASLPGASAIQVTYVATWPTASSTTPGVVLGFQANGISLGALDGEWTGADFLPTFPNGALLLTPTSFTLDTAHAPAEAWSLLGVSSDRQVDLTAGANLFADVDLSQFPGAADVARLLGADVPSSGTAAFDVAGPLGTSANVVFDPSQLPAVQKNALSLAVELPPVSANLPSWLSVDGARIQLSLGSGTPSVKVEADVTVTAGSTTNAFTLDSELSDIVPDLQHPAATIHLGIGLSSTQTELNLPFGLDWLHVTGPTLSLDFDTAAKSFDGELAGGITVGSTSVNVDIAVAVEAGKVAGEVSISGAVPLGDVATWLAGAASPFHGAAFDASALDHVTLNAIDFTFDSAAHRFSLFGAATLAGANVDASVDLGALVSVEGTGSSSKLLFALRAAPHAGQDVSLGDLVPGLGTSFAAGLKMPEAALVVAQPAGDFDTTAMSTPARDFLKTVFEGDDLPDTITLTQNLNLYANLDLGGFGDAALGVMGVDPSNPVLHIEGGLGFKPNELGGSGAPSLSGVDLSASMPAGNFSWLPSWVTFSGAWTFHVAYEAADTSIHVDVSSPSVTIDIPNGSKQFTTTLKISFARTGGGDVDASVEGTLSDWDQPFGISWLSLNSVKLAVSASKHGTDPVKFDIKIEADTTIGGKAITASLDVGNGDSEVCGAGATGVNATIALSLGDSVTVDDVLSGIFGGDYASTLGLPALPDPVSSASFGPATIEATVCPTGGTTKLLVDGTVQAGFQPFPGVNLGMDGMFLAKFPTTGSPTVALGMRPTVSKDTGDPVTMSDLLPGVVASDSPLNFPLSDTNSDDTGFGFLFTTGALSSNSLPDLVKDWLKPLEGLAPGDGGGFSVPSGFGVVGSLRLPAPIGPDPSASASDPGAQEGLVGQLGVSDKLEFSGFFPIGGTNFGGLNLRLAAHVQGSLLPDWIDDADIHFGLSVDSTPSLQMSIGGSLTLAMQQGFPQGAAQTLSSIGVDVPEATAVAADATCPRGGVVHEMGGSNYCVDLLKLSVDAGLTVTEDSVGISLTGNIQSIQGDGSPNPDGWSPYGLTDVSVGQILANVDFTLDPTGLSVDFGLAGSVRLFGKSMDGAFDIEIRPIEAPPFVEIDPKGFRFSFPDGLSMDDIVSVINHIAQASGHPLNLSLGSLPNLAIRNLVLSISPLGVQKLCIAQGFEIGGDLYVNPQGSGPTALRSCDPTTGILSGPPTGSKCSDHTADGCFAGMHLKIDDTGIDGTGSIAAFDAGPLHWHGADVELLVSKTKELLKLSGGVGLGDSASPFASGDFAINFSAGVGSGSNPPVHADFYGKLQIFSFRALAWGGLDLNPLNLFSGGSIGTLDLHFALATKSNVNGADTLNFSSSVNSAAGSIVSSLESVVNEFTTIATQLATDPGGALRSFKTYLQNQGASLPGWLSDSIDQISDILDAANAVGIQPVLNGILNGVDLPGLDGINVPATCIGVTVAGTCYGIPVPATCIVTVVNGHCYSIPPIHIPGVCDLPVFDNVASFQDGCTVQEFANVVLIGPINTILEGIVQGVSAVTSTLEGVFGGSGSLFSLNCASFDLHLSGSSDTTSDQVGLAIDATVLGHEGGFAFSWDFGASVGSNIKSFLNAVFNAIAHPGAVTCSSPDATLFGTTGSGPTTPTGTPALFSTFTVPGSVDEGSPVTVGGTFDKPLASSRTVTIHWGDGSQSSVGVAQGASSFTTSHTFADDDPSATAHDLVGLSASDGTTSIGKSLTLNNVAPSNVTALLSHSTIDEGGTASLQVSFTDPGTPDTHNVDVTWGDGSVSHIPLAAGVTTANPTHLYADDNPSGTSSDTYLVGVQVSDDDTGIGTGSTSVTVDNVAPTLSTSALSPTTVNEGQTLTYTVTFGDVGVLDPHTVQVDWNGDGVYDAAQTVAPGGTQATFTWDFADDDPTGTPQDVDNVKVLVTDDDAGSVTRTIPVTVKNVAPTVTGLSVSAATIAEGGTVTLLGSFDDPGLPDTHTVAIDWGSTQVQGPTSLSVDSSTTVGRTFQATARYGDNGTYPITIVVTDDDTGAVTASTQVVVTNVNPTAAIDLSHAIAAGNGPTLLTTAGQPLGVSARTTDPGSDDLRVTWTWDLSGRYDTSTTTTIHRVNPPANDPAGSPSVQPRDLVDSATHSWTQPCLYTVRARSVDDDGGAAMDQVPLVVTGTSTQLQATGWWYQEYRAGGHPKTDAVTRQCDLDIVGQVSRVYQEQYDASNAAGAAFYLNTAGTSDARRLLGSPLLSAWLNFASGAVGWNQQVDTNCDGRADTSFSTAMRHVEDVFLNAASTRSQLLAQKNVLSCFQAD